jgi:hypothetical protein
MNQKGFSKNILLFILGIFVVGLVSYYYLGDKFLFEQQGPKPEIVSENVIEEEIVLKGIVTGSKSGCEVDGICSLLLGDYEIIWAKGWPQEPRGSVDENINTGDEVEVYGKKAGANIVTIYGNETFYIKKLSHDVALQPPRALKNLCSMNHKQTEFVTSENQSYTFHGRAYSIQSCSSGTIWQVDENGGMASDPATFYFDKRGALLDICQALFWRSGCERFGNIFCEQKNYCLE